MPRPNECPPFRPPVFGVVVFWAGRLLLQEALQLGFLGTRWGGEASRSWLKCLSNGSAGAQRGCGQSSDWGGRRVYRGKARLAVSDRDGRPAGRRQQQSSSPGCGWTRARAQLQQQYATLDTTSWLATSTAGGAWRQKWSGTTWGPPRGPPREEGVVATSSLQTSAAPRKVLVHSTEVGLRSAVMTD